MSALKQQVFMSNPYHFAQNTSYAGCLAKYLYEDIFGIRAIRLINLQKIGEKVRVPKS